MSKAQFATVTIFLVLITAMLGALTYFALQPAPACKNAIEAAKDFPTLPASIMDDYNTDIFTKAENINQQIYRSNEYQFTVLALLAKQNEVLLQLSLACP